MGVEGGYGYFLGPDNNWSSPEIVVRLSVRVLHVDVEQFLDRVKGKNKSSNRGTCRK